MKKIIIALISVPFMLAMGYFLGPKTDYPDYIAKIEPINVPLDALDDYLASREDTVTNLKPGNEARLVWSDSIKQTDWAIVYLHGFSASTREGHPVHETLASRFGMNLYLARIAGHGIESDDAFAALTPADMINSAKEAIAIGQLIGKKVIVMSCSTGGTYSIYLAAHNPDMVDAQVLYSPNIALYDSNAKLLGGRWGLELGQVILGDHRIVEENIGNEKQKWATYRYRTEGLVALQTLIDETMLPEYFQKVTMPIFMGYYYKNEEEQDKVVSVAAMRAFAKNVQTSSDDFRQVAFPESGNHVICSDLHSSDYQGVIDETSLFFEEVLGINVIK
ncbi:MAG: esterase/lipase [Paraglaciecola sp.]|jgi:esterase/lipase